MAVITIAEVKAWLESTKLSPSGFDQDLVGQLTTQVFARLRPTFTSVDTWTNDANTPALVRSIVAMQYAAALYERAYGDDHEDTDNYAGLLRKMAQDNINGLISGSLEITEDDSNRDDSSPAFFPNDASSANAATSDAPSDGGPYFQMGMTF